MNWCLKWFFHHLSDFATMFFQFHSGILVCPCDCLLQFGRLLCADCWFFVSAPRCHCSFLHGGTPTIFSKPFMSSPCTLPNILPATTTTKSTPQRRIHMLQNMLLILSFGRKVVDAGKSRISFLVSEVVLALTPHGGNSLDVFFCAILSTSMYNA